MQEPVREFYIGFEIQLVLRHRDEDGQIETIVFINPTAQAPISLREQMEDLGFRKLHEPGDLAPITAQMDAARTAVDAAIARYSERR